MRDELAQEQERSIRELQARIRRLEEERAENERVRARERTAGEQRPLLREANGVQARDILNYRIGRSLDRTRIPEPTPQQSTQRDTGDTYGTGASLGIETLRQRMNPNHGRRAWEEGPGSQAMSSRPMRIGWQREQDRRWGGPQDTDNSSREAEYRRINDGSGWSDYDRGSSWAQTQGRERPPFGAPEAERANFISKYSPPFSPPGNNVGNGKLWNKILAKCRSYQGQFDMAVLHKEEKKMLQDMGGELQNVERRLIPVDLTFAIFRFDLGGVLKWSPILTSEAQRAYGEALRSAKRLTSTKARTIADQIMDTVTLENEDDGAWDIIEGSGTEANTMAHWGYMVSQTSLPLIRRYWEPIVPGIMTKVEGWLQVVDRDYTRVWQVTKKAIDLMLWGYAQEVARGFAESFEKGAWDMLHFDLVEELRAGVNRMKLEELDMYFKETPGNKRQRLAGKGEEQSRGKRSRWTEDEQRVREELIRKIKSKIPDFDLGKGCTAKVPKHNNQKTKQWGCFFACGGELIARGLGMKGIRLCKLQSCSRSHDTDQVYPEGLKCLAGDCPTSCPARAENTK